MARIYLALDDEITSVIEKLRATQDKHVILVVPKGASLLQSVINLRLLKKKVEAFDKILGLVTADPMTKHLAAQVGVVVYQTLQDVPKSDYIDATAKPQTRLRDEEVVIEPLQSSKDAHPSKTESKSEIIPPKKTVSGVIVKQYERTGSTGAEESGSSVSEAIVDSLDLDTLEESVNAESEQASVGSPTDTEEVGGDDVIMGKEVAPEETSHPKVRLKATRKPVHVPRWAKMSLLLIVILLLTSVVGAGFYVPSAEITVHVPAESITKTVNLVVDTTKEKSQGLLIVGLKHETNTEAASEMKATGKKQVGEKAKGVVTVSNSWSSDAQNLPKNSGLVSSSGLVFRSIADTPIPGATSSISNGQVIVNPGKADVAVVADQPGDQYNLEPTKFSIQGFSGDKATKIMGSTAKAMSGGTNKEITIVSEEDKNQAISLAKQQLDAAVQGALKKVIPDTEVLISDSVVDVQLSDPNHTVGDEAESISVTAKAKALGISIRHSDVEGVLEAIFAEGLSPTKVVILPHPSEIEWQVSAKADGTYTINREISAQVVTKVDENKVKQIARAKNPSIVTSKIIEQLGAKSVDVSISPAGWPLLPLLSSRITVKTLE